MQFIIVDFFPPKHFLSSIGCHVVLSGGSAFAVLFNFFNASLWDVELLIRLEVEESPSEEHHQRWMEGGIFVS